MGILLIICCLFAVIQAYGVCPLCTVAVGAGVGASRWLGVHDAIVGLWIGAFLLALSWWISAYLRAHGYTFIGYRVLVPVAIYATTWFSVWCSCGFGCCRLWGASCLSMGVLIGGVVFAAATITSCVLKKMHNNHVLFYFQKVVIPFVLLLLASILVYVLV